MNNSIKVHKSLMLLKRNYSQINLEIMLSDENKRKTIEKFKKYTKLRFAEKNPEKHAAILIPMCITNNEISILYTIRSSKLRNYSGQVCFPGGKMDDTDNHEIECALRETEEEIGLSSQYIKIWGSGSQITPRDGPSILPIIAEVENFSHTMLTKNPEEVEKIFTISLDRLRDPTFIRHTQFKSRSGNSSGFSMPVYLGGDMRFWGMTATITHFLLCSMLPKELYNRRMPFVNKYDTTN
ncbi:CLUMA_CG004490, isoform A [Clunio marinus]|uniref:CLUMA_CG004490, isoform A n=1 Tax=Clunio marinus TaxID=568069 RepID=A0A1J1HRU2_9DIPT|nr:CLUMA_CG004490, isoform A [Clunio marinus]